MADARARAMRNAPTDAERKLWHALRMERLGARFRRQRPIGPYIVDFISLQDRLIIEVDGGQHAEREAADARRTAFLEAQGFRVIRFWNNDVLARPDAVVAAIAGALRRPTS